MLRPFDDTDIESLVAVWKLSFEHDGFDSRSTLQPLPTAPDIAERAQKAHENGGLFLVAESDRVVVGAIELRWWKEPGELFVYLLDGIVRPDSRNQGIGTSMLLQVEAHARSLHAGTSVTSAAVFGGRSANDDSRALLLNNGYDETFSMVEMQLDVSRNREPVSGQPLPHGLTARSPEENELHLLQQLNAVAYGGRAFVAVETNESIEEFVNGATDLTMWRAVWDESEPVAFVSSIERGGFVEVLEVTVHPDWRRRGIAKTLLSSLLDALTSARQQVVRLHTNGEDVSGARSLYAAMGFEEVRTHRRYRKTFAGAG